MARTSSSRIGFTVIASQRSALASPKKRVRAFTLLRTVDGELSPASSRTHARSTGVVAVAAVCFPRLSLMFARQHDL